MTDDTTTDDTQQHAAEQPEPEQATGYAVYDETLRRFTTGVYKTKKEAAAVAKDGTPASHKTTVRAV